MNHQSLSAFIWSVADLLRGDYKQSDYGKVILPFTVLRRLDCVLEPTKAAVLVEMTAKQAVGLAPEPFLLRKAGQGFYNTSVLDLPKLVGDQDNVRAHLTAYVQGFSANVRDIFERFEFAVQIDRLAKAGLLYRVAEKFANIDLHPNVVDNFKMGLVFEELIRKFAEVSNETAGEHFTLRDVIRLMVNLIFVEDGEALSKPGVVRTIYDPTAGTGGMLSIAEEHLTAMNSKARMTMFGQELNPESYAICKADMLIKGQDVGAIAFGNTLSDDGHHGRKFDYMLSNPPFGVEWKKVEKEVRKEHETDGFNGRFGPGLPRISDGSMLFLMHLLSKMRLATDGGSRFGIVLNGSPLFTGGAGSGESEIRRYVLENDLVEAIIGLPTDMFYNTGISTYIWIVSNRKPTPRKGKVQLIDASSFWRKMRKSLGSKRRELAEEHIADVTRLFGSFVEARLATVMDAEGKETGRAIVVEGETPPAAPEGGKVKLAPLSRIFPNEAFGYRTITVERPLRDERSRIVLGAKGKQKGKPQADSALRDMENVPLSEEVEAYFEREVLPHAADAWIEEIPAHWRTSRVKRLFEIRKRIAGKIGLDVLSITQRGIRLKDIENNDGQLSDDYSKYQIVEIGDFAMNGMDLLTGYVDISRFHGVTSPDYRVFSLRDQNRFSDQYFLRLFQMGYDQKIFYAFGQGASLLGRWRFPTEQFNDFVFPVPPLLEQIEIAAFLERETAKIDALVEEQRRLIALLMEKRQAVISHAVTKGLDPNALMKDSGVEWLGEVPAHWELKQLKRAVVLQRGHDLPSDDRKDGSVPVVSSGGVSGYHNAAITSSSTIVTGRYGSIGEFYFVEMPCWPLNTALYSVDTYDNVTKFIWYMLHAYREHFILNSMKSAVPGVDRNDIHPIRVVVPPLNEQKVIVRLLDGQLSELDRLTEEAGLAIALLQERRSALISAAVTGKIDVGGLVSQAAEAA